MTRPRPTIRGTGARERRLRVSRLRLRLAAGSAAAFLVASTTLNAALALWLARAADGRVGAAAAAAAGALAAALARELGETPPGASRPFARIAGEVLAEWPQGPEALVVLDAAGHAVAVRGDSLTVRRVAAVPGVAGATIDLPDPDDPGAPSLRVAVAPVLRPPRPVRGPAHPAVPGSPRVVARVAAALSTAPAADERRTLLVWLAGSTPAVLVLSVAGGYLLAGRALRPVRALGSTIAVLAPAGVMEGDDRRLPVRAPPDEIDDLAAQFNALLDRLAAAQARNRRFVQQAAHQIRTPLTLVLGEAALALDRAPTEEPDHAHGGPPASPPTATAGGERTALERVRVAAEQMRRRVDELLLLARAEAGERVTARAPVELDELALEGTDLMRARAHALGRGLALGRVEPAVVAGDEALLREALLELLENACRHGSVAGPVTVSAHPGAAAGTAVLAVTSAGPPAELPDPAADETRAGGLGLPIVRWIAEAHGGRLAHAHTDGVNIFTLVLPELPQASPDGAS